jgi:CheY-like chemotaxis protein/HPt (histidine-containing phosphotransfer) domain-containing protein
LELASLVGQGVPTALSGDAGRVRQILVNLLGNAVKFTEEGEVVLRVSLDGEKGYAGGDEVAVVRFEVKDSGIGMTEEQRSRLFRSFSQADASTTRRYGGTGLGLAISKQLVELMGGEIGVQSELGEGSTFFFEVPFERQPEGLRTAPSRRADLRDLSVLVVDDNETNRRIVHTQVLSWGVRNGMAGDGHGALEMLKNAAEEGDPYDLGILDLNMPGMDGMELASRIKADPAIASTQLILLTSMGLRGEAKQARGVGFAAYLTKPVRQSKLYDAIATVMGAPPFEGQAGMRPAYEEAPIVTRHSLEEARAHSRERLWRAHVLVAEDNQVNQKVAVKMLERLGYRADVAANGLEALEALSRIPYAAILMDVQMPEMDGYEATAEIRRREKGEARGTPIIAMTANAMQGDRGKALEAEMDDYVSKPVKPKELEAALERWVSIRYDAGSLATGLPIAKGGDSAEDSAQDSARNSARNPPVSLVEGFEAEDTPLLDDGVLENLLDLGGAELLSELSGMFFDDSGSALTELREAAEQGDAPTVKRVAHALKGGSGNMGAKGMARICAELEKAGAFGDLSRAPALVGQLEEEFGSRAPGARG